MSPVIESGLHAGQANALYGALLRLVRRCMELSAWTEVANSDIVLCVPVRRGLSCMLALYACYACRSCASECNVSFFCRFKPLYRAVVVVCFLHSMRLSRLAALEVISFVESAHASFSSSPLFFPGQAVTKDSTAHLGVSATASVFTKREHTDVSEFMTPSAPPPSSMGMHVWDYKWVLCMVGTISCYYAG